MNSICHPALQKKMDLQAERIDTLERDKESAGDDDLSGVLEEAKQFLQMAREDYSRGELEDAWLKAVRSEYCVVVFGRAELDGWKRLTTEIAKALR